MWQTMLAVPVVQLLINVAVLVLAVYQKPHRMGVGLAILFAGIPVYWVGVLWRSKPPEMTQLIGKQRYLVHFVCGGVSLTQPLSLIHI